MPDLQTALNNAINNQLKNTINDWEKDDMQITQTKSQGANYGHGTKAFSITNNVTRATFDYVKKNPNLTSAELCASMERLGYKSSSVGSLLAQFAKQGLAERDDRGRYITIVDEYRPLKAKKKAIKVVAKPVETPKRKYEKKAVTGIGALLREKLEASAHSRDEIDAASLVLTEQNKRFTSLVRNRHPQDVLKDMTVYQAHELYVHLKQMFGG